MSILSGGIGFALGDYNLNPKSTKIKNEPVIKKDKNQIKVVPITKEEATKIENEPVTKEDKNQIKVDPITKEEATKIENEPVIKEDKNQNKVDPIIQNFPKINRESKDLFNQFLNEGIKKLNSK